MARAKKKPVLEMIEFSRARDIPFNRIHLSADNVREIDVDAGLDDYDDALEDIELDLIRCLITPKGPPIEWMPRGTTAVSLSTSEHFPPGNGERSASVMLPIQLSLIIRP